MGSSILPSSVTAIVLTGLITAAPSAFSANWLMLQGTETAGKEKHIKLFGALAVNYQKIAVDNPTDTNRFNQINPQKTITSGFILKQAKMGARGSGFLFDKRINYLIAFEAGNNALTLGQGMKVAQASLTYQPAPGVRLRIGQFKTPTSIEAMAPPRYLNYSGFTVRDAIERFTTSSTATQLSSTNAFRDIGVQLFDRFTPSENWEHSYALMLGNGSIEHPEQTKREDIYAKWSSHYLLGGGYKGMRHDIEMTAWLHQGTRLDKSDESFHPIQRSGVGVQYFDGTLRLGAEWATATGKIADGTPTQKLNYDEDGTSTGYMLETGYKIQPNITLNIRYDTYQKQVASTVKKESTFTRWTLGTQYRLNPKANINFNYEIKSGSSDHSGTDAKLDKTGNLIGVQLTQNF